MKPKPFSALNHFTVPCTMVVLSSSDEQICTVQISGYAVRPK
jgi:hypothetical protein